MQLCILGSPSSAASANGTPGSDSDSDESVEGATAASASQSLVDVHPNPAGSINRTGYGATTTVNVSNETGEASSRHSNEDMEGAVGGVAIEDDGNSVDFIDDHYSVENEMRRLVNGDTDTDIDENKGFFVKVFGRKKNRKRKRDEEA